jgi:hypothetical protein
MNNNQIIEITHNSTISEEKYAISEQKNEVFQCRICLEDEENIDLLVSPCRCSGTSKYVHVECLRIWRYQDINADGFSRCMECNEDYIILNNDGIENEKLFDIFNGSNKVMYFELGISFLLSFFIYIIDVFINDYYLVKIFPKWYDNKLLKIVKENTFYENLFYLNFSIYIQNNIFVLVYILRCCLYVKNKKKLSRLMGTHVATMIIYYNVIWLFMLGMGSYDMYEFAITTISVYELFSYKLNNEMIKNHNNNIRIINNSLDTGVSSMEYNPLNIIIGDQEVEEIAHGGTSDESDTSDESEEFEDDNSQLLS